MATQLDATTGVPDSAPRGDVVFLLSAPDATQAWFSAFPGDPTKPEDMSPQIMALRHVLGVAEELSCLPLSESEIVVTSAMGCRPFSLKDGRKLVKPNASSLKACRPRWELEVLLAQPRLIVAFGAHAFGALGVASAKNYSASKGEVYMTHVGPKGGGRDIPVYVGPDPHRALLLARQEEWSHIDRVAPPVSAPRFPVADLLWHTVLPLWLVAIERHLANGGTWESLSERLRRGWSLIQAAASQYAASKESVGDVVADLVSYVERVRSLELSAKPVREFMITPIRAQRELAPAMTLKMRRREEEEEEGLASVLLDDNEDVNEDDETLTDEDEEEADDDRE